MVAVTINLVVKRSENVYIIWHANPFTVLNNNRCNIVSLIVRNIIKLAIRYVCTTEYFAFHFLEHNVL